MRRAGLLLALVGLLGFVALVGLFGPTTSDAPPPAPAEPATHPERRVTRFAPRRPLPDAVPDDRVEAHRRATAHLAESCGLPLAPFCDDTGCATVLTAPDLDRPLGWASMTWRHPWFVGNVLARDLGLGGGPCGAALSSTTEAIRVWEPAGRDEVWCTAQVPDGDTGADDLCDRAAAAVLGVRDAAFADSSRRLAFTR